MLDYEFKKEVDRLALVFPQHFSAKVRVQLIFERVKDLEIGWFRKCVDRMIITNDPRFNFDDAARGERLARKQVELTNDIVRAQEALAEKISDEGLQKALAAIGAKSLADSLRFKPTGGIMDFYQYHDKCLGGCGKKCLTRSGYCKACRIYTCKRCQKEGVWSTHKLVYCTSCEDLMKRQTQYESTSAEL